MKEFLDISMELGNKEQQAEACAALAKSYRKEGNDEESRKYAKRWLRISNSLDEKTDLLMFAKGANVW